MIQRDLEATLRRASSQFPVVTLTGPRQSGKTTLCRALFPNKRHVSLEEHDVREFALRDPRRFLELLPGGAIVDEVQRAPELPSYLQGVVDRDPRAGMYILTGSLHLGLMASVSQSLAGRTAVLHLLPPSLGELRRFPGRGGESLDEVLWRGAYPRIHDRDLDATDWLRAYVRTYVERDVRQVLKVGDLLAFETFVALTAGRTAQLVNLTSLGSDAGVDQKTAKAWLSVLEASFLVFRIAAFAHNLGMRWIKAPKLHFFDSGLLCYLLGVRSPDQLATHPLRGAIFESWVISEIYKARAHAGIDADLFHWRNARGAEVDCVVLDGTSVRAVEVKAGKTIASEFFRDLRSFLELLDSRDPLVRTAEGVLVYGGDERQQRSGVAVTGWSDVPAVDWVQTTPDRAE